MPWILVTFLFPFLLIACATTPTPLAQGPFSELTPATAQGAGTVGQRIRWGGVIVSVQPSRTETCFEILSRPLDGQGRPRETDATDGRFLACAAGFYDPAAYPTGRELTVVGTVQPAVVLKIGEYNYQAPRVRVENLHLWREREIARGPGYYDPFWYGPWYPWPYRYPYRHPFYW